MSTTATASTLTATTTVHATRLLFPQHIADLRRSGLTDVTIAESGIYSSNDPHEIGRLLKWSGPAKGLGPAMIIPFRRLDGKLDGFARVRPDHPRQDHGKYEQPVGVGNRAYFPLATCEAAGTPVAPLGLTEGEKKSLAAAQAGAPFIGLTGVWNWQRPRPKTDGGKAQGKRKLIDDLAQIDWQGRPVVICFDTDSRRNPDVNHARAELARVLTEHGARIRFLDLPAGPRGLDGLPGKMGLDDFIAAFGGTAFHELLGTLVE